MKDLNTPAVENTPSLSSVPGAEKAPTDAYVKKLESAEAAVQRARDMACMFAYLTLDIPDNSQNIELDLQALRGVMGRLWGDLDEALGSFREAQELFSVIAKKPNL